MTDNHAADVHAELQLYLNSKNINSLFISIVESLLIEKPANPIAYIVDYLYKEYPEQAAESLCGLSERPQLTNPSAAVEQLKSPVLKVNPAKICYKSDSEDDDGLDLVSDMVIVPSVGPVSESRRVSVSAESVDATMLRKRRSQLLVVEKSADVMERLLNVVGMSPLLRTLDAEQRDMIVQAFTGPILKNAGDIIIQQGDSGDVFYLLEDGLVNVSIRRKGEEPKQVHTYHSGDSFGELAIMYNAPRAATCTAQNACKLWALDRNSFKVIVVAAAMQKRETYSAFLARVPILQSLTEMEVMTLADALQEEEYQDGTPVCTQGEDGDYFYIIKDGIAVCSQTGDDGEDKVVATLTAGNYFGEIVLLTKKPRQATVKASGTLKVLALERATFTRVFGNLDEMMKRNMEEYNKYAASGI